MYTRLIIMSRHIPSNAYCFSIFLSLALVLTLTQQHATSFVFPVTRNAHASLIDKHEREHERVHVPSFSSIARLSSSFDDYDTISTSAPAIGLYEIQEETITKRGQLEEEIMSGASQPISENKVEVKGVGAGGGFGGGSGTGSSGTKKPTKSALKAQGKNHAKVLRDQGVVRIDNVLSTTVADDLRNFCFSLRETAQLDIDSGKIRQKQRYADVLLGKNRCDLTMPLGQEVVYRGLFDSLCRSPVGQTTEALLGKQAVLYELSCLISDPGSDRQVVHPDTPCASNDEDAVLYTCFMALQDIRMDMGPTTWLPGTHTKEAHDTFQEETISEGKNTESPKDDLLRNRPSVLGILPKGACGIFDSRLLHCGTANRSLEDHRALFYFSFKNPNIGYPGNPASIRPELAGKLRLSALIKELESFDKGKGCKELDTLAAQMK